MKFTPNYDFNPSDIKQAVALLYDGENAPVVCAKGDEEIAAQIAAIAQESGVPLCENPELAQLLMTLELGDNIPEALYISIATVIAFAYELTGKAPE